MTDDDIRHPAIGSGESHRWTVALLRDTVTAQARADAARGVSVVPWRGVARSMETLDPRWRGDDHHHYSTMGACPLDEVHDDLARLYADTEQEERL